MKPKVYIVGAGPGEARLITLKAVDCIKKADVILYDRLIPKDILGYRKASCKLEYAGKAKNIQTMPQDEINTRLLKYAREQKTVVRLKGGDPFIFARGAEEVLFLKSHGIESEVVPGISSFYAVPEICGIPLTHRGISSSFLVVTGHEDPGKTTNNIDWGKIAHFDGTVVILMGKTNLISIARKLIDKGMDRKKMCAVISKGMTKHQKLITAPLYRIAHKAKYLPAPSVIVMGDVVKVRALAQKRYLATASNTLSRDVEKKLGGLGADVDCVPMLKILPPKDYSVLDDIILNVKKFDWLVFTSRHGVLYFLKRFGDLGADKNLLRKKIACVGYGTAAEFKKYDILPSLVPAKFTTRNLALALRATGVCGKKIALMRTALKKDVLKDVLSRAGAVITDCTVYHVKEPHNAGRIEKALLKIPDGILFLSSRAVDSFFNQLCATKKHTLKHKSLFFSIGPVTTQALRRQGINKVLMPREHTVDGLVNLCIDESLKKLN